MCNTEKVWNATLADRSTGIAGLPPEAQQPFKAIVEKLPATLADLLDQKAALGSLARARHAVVSLMITDGFAGKLYSAFTAAGLGSEVPQEFELAGLLATKQVILQYAVNATAEGKAVNVNDDVMVSVKKSWRTLLDTGVDPNTLTIRDVLETYPGVIMDLT